MKRGRARTNWSPHALLPLTSETQVVYRRAGALHHTYGTTHTPGPGFREAEGGDPAGAAGAMDLAALYYQDVPIDP